MPELGETRIQLCGRFVARLHGRRVEDSLPGRLGQLLFAYLVLNRLRRLDRDELLIAVYGENAAADHQARLSVLLSKLRRVVGSTVLSGRSQIELVLSAGAFVDVEVALEALHRAESHVAKEEWAAAWGASSLAHDITSRPLFDAHDRPWLEEWQRRLDDARLSALECVAAASLAIGGAELPQAVRSARELIELAPFRETGHRVLMEALVQSGNVAEALRAYDRLRVTLREELGIAPSQTMQDIHRRLLGGAATALP